MSLARLDQPLTIDHCEPPKKPSSPLSEVVKLLSTPACLFGRAPLHPHDRDGVKGRLASLTMTSCLM